jgi:hypothetical protein
MNLNHKIGLILNDDTPEFKFLPINFQGRL